MKIHYVNILLFALPLNIFVILFHAHNKNKPHIALHTPTKKPIKSHRTLCECELYTPANYDNDPQMKEVMDNFNRQTQQRFHEYDERMVEKRMQCKDKCDKEIQKIILKDKLEKQMKQELTTLETKITTDDIPTCICEKSLADKMEKGCLRCAGVLGGGVMPGMGLIDGSLLGAISVLQPLEIAAAKAAAVTEATALATKAGMREVVLKIEGLLVHFTEEQKIFDLTQIVTPSTFNNGPALFKSAKELASKYCVPDTVTKRTSSFCSTIQNGETTNFVPYANAGRTAYNETLPLQKALLEKAKVGAVEATYASYQTAIIASIVAIVVIVLIMVIIYKILRYRRKKKMKKKLQYIKLLEE